VPRDRRRSTTSPGDCLTVSLSIIVPTLGRPTLHATLHSIATQLDWCDQVIVVADPEGDVNQATATLNRVAGADRRWVYAEAESDGAGVGGAQRTLGMTFATGTHLAFIDDDDTYRRGALDLIRDAACDRPVIFRMQHPRLNAVPTAPRLAYGDVGTPCFVVPNERDALGEWVAHLPGGSGADFTFIAGCVERMGEPVWRNEVIATVRPHECEEIGEQDAA